MLFSSSRGETGTARGRGRLIKTLPAKPQNPCGITIEDSY